MDILNQATAGVAISDLCRKHGISTRLACEIFQVSETYFRYQPVLTDENILIADWLVKLASTWRNVRGFKWNRKRVYCIYKALKLNLRIKQKTLDSSLKCLGFQHPSMKFGQRILCMIA
jgi:hypothetical protein